MEGESIGSSSVGVKWVRRSGIAQGAKPGGKGQYVSITTTYTYQLPCSTTITMLYYNYHALLQLPHCTLRSTHYFSQFMPG